MNKYNHSKIEKKWQNKWIAEKIFSPDVKLSKNPFYNLMMFPYPSAEGLHVGNMYAFTGADVYGRFKRMNGYDVFEPIGLDGFGIHSENYAIKIGRHPKEHAKISQKNFYRQLHTIGNSFDWERTLETYDPEYYKWTQWLFIQMFKAGLAYKGTAVVNWCPKDLTVLSDEQVEGGKCERCGSEVTKREMSSWFFRITKYADRLLENIEKIKWPEKIKIAQRNWIGKSNGKIIKFQIKNTNEHLEVFTTRPDTLNAVTFLATSEMFDEGSKEKKGEFSGKFAINPLDGREIPIWKTNYVSPTYGTGVVMGVPAHDERDMDFAIKYKIEILRKDPKANNLGKLHTAFHLRDWGISRQRYWGPPIPMIYCKDCASKNTPLKGVSLQDSLQGVAGWPAGNASHSDAGWFPVPEKDLPVILPDIVDFKPQGDGTSPLHNAPDSWKNVECPNCGKMAERELDVSDTFLDSAWYFLRYPSVGLNSKETGNMNNSSELWKLGIPWNQEITRRWLPVNAYIGGAEHAVLHLMYARFVTMVLSDLGYLSFEEPFPFLFGHGLIIKDGAKMSKSKGNVVNPDGYIEKFGADTLRTYLMFLGRFDQGGDFRDSGIEGMKRFLDRVYRLFQLPITNYQLPNNEINSKLHQTIKKVTQDVGNFKYNTAISSLMELVNALTEFGSRKVEGGKEVGKMKSEDRNSDLVDQTSIHSSNFRHQYSEVMPEVLRSLLLMLAPFAPHLTEELWSVQLKKQGSIHLSSWPKYDAKYLKVDHALIVVQVNGKVRSTLSLQSPVANLQSEVVELAKKDEKIAKWLDGKKIKKVIFVPGKIINFVV